MDSDQSPRVRTLLHLLIDDEEVPFTDLPELFEALESDERATRVAAAWALCLLAERQPADAEEIYSRLATHDSFAALLASNWLLKHHGEEWLDDRGSVDVDSEGNPLGRRSVGTARDDDSSQGARVVDADQTPSSGDGGEETTDSDDSTDEASADSSERTKRSMPRGYGGQLRRPARNPANRPPREDAVVQDGDLAIRAESTDPESVRVLARLSSDRYSWTYVGVGKLYGRSQEFLLRTYVPPNRVATEFEESFTELMDTWRGVDDTDGVGTVLDWSLEPDPWVITGFANDSVRSIGTLKPRVAFETALEITGSVADLHAKGTVHGSLNPSTVFLDRSGDRLEPKIVDAGLGGALDDGGADWLPLREVESAPELLNTGYGGLDWMTDVYHLGVVIYTLFTGRSLDPTSGAGPSAIPDPTALNPALPPAADRIVGKATGAHKVMRYESVDELGRDLLSAIADNWGEPQ